MSTDETDTPQSPDDDHPRPRRRSPLAVVSVAAAVLVAGGGGAYWASTAADGSGTAHRDGSPKPLALDAYPSAGHEGIAPGEPDPSGGRYVTEEKLPDGPDSAPVYLSDPKVTKSDVARLAEALDVPGSPRGDHGYWKVGGTRDAAGPVLRVSQDGPGSWTYSRYGTPAGGTCVRLPGSDGDAGAGSGKGDGGTARDCPTYRDGKSGKKSGEKGDDHPERSDADHDKVVSEAKAKRTAEPVLKALGLSDAKLDATGRYAAIRTVNAEPRVGGLPTHGWSTSLQVAADGQLVGGSGTLSTPKQADTYPLISADEALKKLNAATRGRGPAKGGTCPSATPGSDGPEAGGEIAPCEPNPSGTSSKVTVRKVTFGLASHRVEGRRALVPSWIFETRPTGNNGVSMTLPYPAVQPEYIKKAAGTESPGHGHSGTSDPSGKKKIDDISSYSVDGKTLTLRFWGGVCRTYSVSAQETSKQVTVEIKSQAKHPGRACILIAKEMTKKVTLDKPLGDRKVVDKATGETVPPRKK
ncbi:hypothetical protein HUT19_29775 [Streptomyces sp. NA02950]|uniref:hypothetical protein n=1 Tax=Streptomyces sp. NA02950 TaxID=2742137 RepID=UPI001590DED8|nr:hypothetical protein [Streptomyces sp. NA02950]QKV95404.1 hypothetical protein HUT19_29775 [Streptomyces sp. NA02950]